MMAMIVWYLFCRQTWAYSWFILLVSEGKKRRKRALIRETMLLLLLRVTEKKILYITMFCFTNQPSRFMYAFKAVHPSCATLRLYRTTAAAKEQAMTFEGTRCVFLKHLHFLIVVMKPCSSGSRALATDKSRPPSPIFLSQTQCLSRCNFIDFWSSFHG